MMIVIAIAAIVIGLNQLIIARGFMISGRIIGSHVQINTYWQHDYPYRHLWAVFDHQFHLSYLFVVMTLIGISVGFMLVLLCPFNFPTGKARAKGESANHGVESRPKRGGRESVG
jgi:hypothetical protein